MGLAGACARKESPSHGPSLQPVQYCVAPLSLPPSLSLSLLPVPPSSLPRRLRALPAVLLLGVGFAGGAGHAYSMLRVSCAARCVCLARRAACVDLTSTNASSYPGTIEVQPLGRDYHSMAQKVLKKPSAAVRKNSTHVCGCCGRSGHRLEGCPFPRAAELLKLRSALRQKGHHVKPKCHVKPTSAKSSARAAARVAYGTSGERRLRYGQVSNSPSTLDHTAVEAHAALKNSSSWATSPPRRAGARIAAPRSDRRALRAPTACSTIQVLPQGLRQADQRDGPQPIPRCRPHLGEPPADHHLLRGVQPHVVAARGRGDVAARVETHGRGERVQHAAVSRISCWHAVLQGKDVGRQRRRPSAM